MEGLKSSRVVVVDDEPSEATPILRALSSDGISAAYFTGDVDELPAEDKPLSGVRLIFLDARLQGDGARANISANLVAVIQRILSPNNGPYGIILWTKHPEDLEDFQNRIFASNVVAPPLFIKLLKKASFQDEDNNFDIGALRGQLADQVSDLHSFRVLFKWEEEAGFSISEVTSSLYSDLVEKDTDIGTTSKKTVDRLNKTLRKLAAAELGQGLNKDNFCEGVFKALTPIFYDRIASKSPSGLDDCSKLLYRASSSKDRAIDGKLNTRIHLDFSSDRKLSPGSMYIYDEKRRGFPKYDDFRFLLKEEANALPKDEDKIELAKKKRNDLFEALKKESKLIAVEVSPDCDYAQNKIQFARFVCGILTTDEQKKLLDLRSPALWSKENFWFEEGWPSAGDPKYQCIVLNLRFVVTLPIGSVSKFRKIVRLRDQLCGDLRNELAEFMARPGIVYLS